MKRILLILKKERKVRINKMKKAIILFLIFLVIDICLFAILSNFNGGKDFDIFFLAAMFMEIAFFGSFIIYEISKQEYKNN